MIIASAFLIFIIGTGVDIVLQIQGIRWNDYPTFATITGGGAMAGKVGDKIVNTVTSLKYAPPERQTPVKRRKNPE